MKILLKNNATFSKAHEKFERFTQDDTLMDMYLRRKMARLDRDSSLADAEERGMEKGIQKGKKENAESVAKNCMMQGLPHTMIASITGLSIDEIEEIARTCKNPEKT